MGPQVIWLFMSYGIVMSISLALLEGEQTAIAYAILFLFPGIRVARRFRKQGGYHLMGGAGVVSGSLSERGGFASRESNAFFFWACFLVEILVIAWLGFYTLRIMFRA